MRVRLLTIAALFLLIGGATTAQAQSVAFGLKGGVNFANLDIAEEEEEIDFDRRTGFVGGGFLVWPANARVALQLEALYSQKGARFDEPGVEVHLNLNYFEVPILVRASTARNSSGVAFHAFGGPAFAFRTSAEGTASFEGESATQDIGEDVSKNDVGLVVGGGVEVGRFVFDVRQTWGLMNINKNQDEGDTTMKNRAFTVMAGVRF